jgi:hypothetical protein
MRQIIDYIRSWFCRHEWECLMECVPVYEDAFAIRPSYYKWLYVCKKCKHKKIVKSQ